MLDGVIEELRFATPSARRGDSPAAFDAAAGGRPRVLVVEDNPDMNRFIVECLSREYDVVPAFDGREGLEKALQFRPTLIVSDIMMPNVSGVEMIAAMRRQPELETTPVLLLSAKADEELLVKLLDDGARDYVVKPFSEKELMVRVRNAVHAEQARAQMQVLHAAAESANRAKDEFLAMLGHELRNPLSPILTALQLMQLRGEAGSARERVIIERQVTHLSRLVDDLLDVSRITRGRDRAQARAVDIADVVARGDRDGEPAARAADAQAPRRGAAKGLRVDGDPTRLARSSRTC